MRPTPNLEDKVSVFMSPSDRVAQLYAQAPGSFFVLFYDSHAKINELRIVKTVKESVVSYLEALSRNFLRETEENHTESSDPGSR
jgi:hypothetical protein